MPKQNCKSFSSVLLFAGILFFMVGCGMRPSGVLSKSDMVSFLTDLHKLDGTLNAKGMGNAQDRENLYYYNSLLKKHGITKAQFDSSLVFYTENPKRFNDIYDQVVKNLTAFQEDVNKLKYHPVDSAAMRHTEQNIWQNPIKHALTKDSARTQGAFEITKPFFKSNDTYRLSFLQKIEPKDSSAGKYVMLKVKYSDGKTDSIYTKSYADGLTRRFTLTLRTKKQKEISSVSGKFLGSKGYKGTQSANIDSIRLIRIYDAIAQDSIRKALMKRSVPSLSGFDSTANSHLRLRLRSKVLLYKKPHEKDMQSLEHEFAR